MELSIAFLLSIAGFVSSWDLPPVASFLGNTGFQFFVELLRCLSIQRCRIQLSWSVAVAVLSIAGFGSLGMSPLLS